jgi:hypothetical protein
MGSYVRPAVAEQTYRAADGSVIEYGNRWGDHGPPEDSYSVDSHPDRFAPLHQIADALIDYLRRTYDVQVVDDLSCAQDVGHTVDAVRAVRLTPATRAAASLTFVFTTYPGVTLHAGLLHDFRYPQCGCDACDESLASVADELECTVLTVVSGGYREQVRGSRREPWIWCELKSDDGSRSSSRRVLGSSELGTDLEAASARLNALSDGWAAWPSR